MKKALLIAEKPDYMRDIQKVYNKYKSEIPFDIDFAAQRGHLLQLLEPSELNELYKSWDISYLPIVPENEGGWQYKVIPGAEQALNNIKTILNSGKYDYVIHAGDSDQEGELIVRLVLQRLKNRLPVLRLWVNATTEEEIRVGLKNMRSDDEAFFENLYAAAIVRQHSDWRFGINGSRAVAGKIITSKDNKVAIGRVMTVILAIVVQREDEIKDFKPHTSYGVTLSHENGLKSQLFKEETYEENGKVIKNQNLVYFDTKEEAENLVKECSSSSKVISVEKKNEKVYAPKLYSLADLQYDASKLNFSPDETLGIIQSLYEKHFLTYPRTDCNYLNSTDKFEEMILTAGAIQGYESVATEALKHIEEVKKNKKFVNNEELKKHGHSAICPTDVTPDFDSLPEDEQIIYKLVCRRFLSIFLPPMIQCKTTVITDNNGSLFRAIGKITIEKGYTEFIKSAGQDSVLPEINEGDVLVVSSKDICEKTTTCPKRFTSGELVRALENPAKFLKNKNITNKNFRIGTSATRSDIIKKLIEDKHLKQTKNNVLAPTEWGTFLAHTLKDIDITKADMIAKWENILTELRDGELSVEQAEDMMRKEVKKMVLDIGNMEEYTFGDVNANRRIIGACPYCGKDIISSDKNYFCSGFKDGCNISIPRKFLGAEFAADDAMTLIKGASCFKKLKKEKTSWKQELRYDKEQGRLEFVKNKEMSEVTCPKCNHFLSHDGAILKCDCGYKIWTRVAGRELSDEEIVYIFTHGKSKGKLNGFVSSKGKKFSAQLLLKKDASGFEFNFE